MQLGRVIGSVTSTVKHPSLSGWRLLLVQPLMSDGESHDGPPQLAVDMLGAGKEEVVVITNDGRSTREMVGDDRSPARWSVIGLRDSGSGTA